MEQKSHVGENTTSCPAEPTADERKESLNWAQKGNDQEEEQMAQTWQRSDTSHERNDFSSKESELQVPFLNYILIVHIPKFLKKKNNQGERKTFSDKLKTQSICCS